MQLVFQTARLFFDSQALLYYFLIKIGDQNGHRPMTACMSDVPRYEIIVRRIPFYICVVRRTTNASAVDTREAHATTPTSSNDRNIMCKNVDQIAEKSKQ